MVSAPITPTGRDGAATLTLSSGLEARIDGGPWGAGGELPEGDSFELRATAPATFSQGTAHAAGTGAFTGHASVDLDGGGPKAPLQHWCDGPDTLIAAQFETTPVPWDAGVAADLDDRAAVDAGRCFALGADQLPAHDELAFGRIGGSADSADDGVGDFGMAGEILDRLAFEYTTSDIPLSVVEGLGGEVRAAGTTYHLSYDDMINPCPPHEIPDSPASGSEVVRAGLRALQERDAAVDRWLREEVAPVYDAMQADPDRARGMADVFADVRKHHARRPSARE